MDWNKWKVVILPFVMLSTGSANTLFGKWADRTPAMGESGFPVRTFNHPFFQACCMFIGEMSCGIVFLFLLLHRKRKGEDTAASLGKMTFNLKKIFTEKGAFGRSFFVFLPPALCDMTGTSLMYIALNYTTAASYQMLRGSVIVFVALLSIAYLRRHIPLFKWIGILGVVCGLIIVGMSDFIFNPTDMPLKSVITGDLLVIMAQVVSSHQMVYEERFVRSLDADPLCAVGLEGFYGLLVLSLLTIPMYFVNVGPQFSGSPQYRLEDMIDAFDMFASNWQVTVAIVGLCLSIGTFNWAGISVTKYLTATTRMVIDSCRTFIIWGATLGLGWQNFAWLQIIGFLVLTTSVGIYNQILTVKRVEYVATCKCCRKPDEEPLVTAVNDPNVTSDEPLALPIENNTGDNDVEAGKE